MSSGHDPFGPPPGDPFGAPPQAPPVFGGQPATPPGFGTYPGGPYPGGPDQDGYNTLAVLAPVFAVVLPPAGVALGHMALPQIERNHQKGRGAAISGLVIGYLMCVVLIAGGLWWALQPAPPSTSANSSTQNPVATAPSVATTPSVVTSVAPPSAAPRIKLDLATVAVGTCVEVQVRSTSRSDALDLYGTDCRHAAGVYVVTARVGGPEQCNTESATSPPDRSFALCLNRY
jgi:hypothetical protein